MQDVPYEEAKAILSSPLICEDASDWIQTRDKPWYQYIENGLLHADDGTRAGLIMRFEYSTSTTTNKTMMQATIYQGHLGGLRRVYQMTIRQFKKPIKDTHSQPHEHIGTLRQPINKDCAAWSFDETVAYFCEQTNLTFTPPIHDPTQLHLK